MALLVARTASSQGSGDFLIVGAIPAKMAPQIIHPRPDAEMSAYARAARCPSAIPWEIPIVVQGGSWPFKYELVSGPSGMAFQRETLPTDWLANGAQGYGILEWSSPTVGSHTVEVLVTDQDLTEVTRTWTLEVIDRENTSYFLFVDSVNGDDADNGSYSNPIATIFEYYGGLSKTDATNAGKQIFYRTGTYFTYEHNNSSGVPQNNSQHDFGTSKPNVHIGFPGETATIDCSEAFFDFENGNDVAFCGLSFIGPGPRANDGVLGPRKTFFRFGGNSAARRLLYDNYYDGGGDTESTDGTNSSVTMNSDTSGDDSYGCDVHCGYYRCDNMDLGLYYATSDFVVEFATVTGGYGGTYNPSWGFFFKGADRRRITVRAVRSITGTIIRPTVHCSEVGSSTAEEIEVCWSNMKNSATSGSGVGCIRWGQGSTGLNYGNFWSYRNNINDDYLELTGINSHGYFEFENDVHQHDGGFTDGFTFTNCDFASPPPEFVKTDLATGTAMVDATTNLLTGSARTTYLGTHGCETVLA